MSKSNRGSPSLRASKKIRGDWGDIKPVTKIIPNKKKEQKIKHKNKDYEEE